MAGQADNGHGTWLANLSANLTQEKADVFKQQLGSCLAAAGMLPSSLWPRAGTMDDGSEGALRALLGKRGPPANFREYDSGAAHGKDNRGDDCHHELGFLPLLCFHTGSDRR